MPHNGGAARETPPSRRASGTPPNLRGAPRVRVSVWFAVFAACLLVTDSTGIAALGLFAALIHELGHIAALCLLGAPPAFISLRLFGAEMRLRGDVQLRYGQEVLVALAGGAANLVLAALALVCAACGLWERAMLTLAAASLGLAALNLLPVSPLDGGRALEAALCLRLPPEQARRIALIVAAVLLVPLAGAGFFVLLTTRCNVSLLLVAAYLGAVLVLGDPRRLFGRAKPPEPPAARSRRRTRPKRRAERDA